MISRAENRDAAAAEAQVTGSLSAAWISTAVAFVLLLVYLLLRAPTAEFFLGSLDHGYQLAVGRMVLSGRLQGADFFTLYGPLVGMVSAAGLLLPGRPVGEVVICAVGFALSGTLVFRIVRSRAGYVAGAASVVLMLALLPRYYKWYYWLMPLIGIAMSTSYLRQRSTPRSGLAAAWGIAAGVALLVRLDLGAHGIAYGLFCLVMFNASDLYAGDRRRVLIEILSFLLCAGLPLFVYGIILAAHTGNLLAGFDLLDSMMSATQGVVTYWGKPLPSLAGINWWSLEAGTWILYGAVPLCYVLALATAFFTLRSRRPEWRDDAVLLIAFAVGGLGILPQALSRRDLQHLLQTLPPFFVVIPIAAHLSWRWASTFQRGAAGAIRILAAIGVTATVVATMMVRPDAGSDLGPLRRDHREAWHRLANLPDAVPGNPVSIAADALRALTGRDERVFVAMHYFNSPVIVFSDRQTTGLQPVYMPGILTTSKWMKRDVERLAKEPIRILVVDPNEWATAPPEEIAPYDAATVTRWRDTYRHVLFSGVGFEIRSR